jgi:hypothetical protein
MNAEVNMFHRAKDLVGYKLGAKDGEIGRVKDFYFEDNNWTIRYLIADTGTWLSGRLVLLSPFALEGVDDKTRHFNVKLTKDHIERSPSIEHRKPVSRQFEAEYARHYGWPMYWYGPALWGPTPQPFYEATAGDLRNDPSLAQQSEDPHLRSASEVAGYYLHATDGDLGHVHDFVIADEDWAIRYIIVETGSWWSGKKALIPTDSIREVNWEQSKVYVDLSQAAIKSGPEFMDHIRLSRDFEEKLHEAYRRDPYWRSTRRAA